MLAVVRTSIRSSASRTAWPRTTGPGLEVPDRAARQDPARRRRPVRHQHQDPEAGHRQGVANPILIKINQIANADRDLRRGDDGHPRANTSVIRTAPGDRGQHHRRHRRQRSVARSRRDRCRSTATPPRQPAPAHRGGPGEAARPGSRRVLQHHLASIPSALARHHLRGVGYWRSSIRCGWARAAVAGREDLRPTRAAARSEREAQGDAALDAEGVRREDRLEAIEERARSELGMLINPMECSSSFSRQARRRDPSKPPQVTADARAMSVQSPADGRPHADRFVARPAQVRQARAQGQHRRRLPRSRRATGDADIVVEDKVRDPAIAGLMTRVPNADVVAVGAPSFAEVSGAGASRRAGRDRNARAHAPGAGAVSRSAGRSAGPGQRRHAPRRHRGRWCRRCSCRSTARSRGRRRSCARVRARTSSPRSWRTSTCRSGPGF